MNNMEKVGNMTVVEATSRFKKVDISLIENENIDCLTLGIYTKLIVLGKKWNLNVKGLRSHLGLSDEKVRKALALLEQEGYIVRTPCRDEKGHLLGWNYTIYPVPVNEDDRSQAGKRKENQQVGLPSSPIPDHSDNGGLINNRNKETLEIKDLPKEERIDKSIPKKKSFDVYADLSYVDAPYAAIWQEWLDYKKEIKKQYKTQRGAKSQYNTLIKYADNNPILANAIVKISIEHSWDGFFALTDKQMDFFLSPKSPYAIEEKGYESLTNTTMPTYKSKGVQTNNIPNGLTKEQYDMYISNGYTIADDGMLLKDGVLYK